MATEHFATDAEISIHALREEGDLRLSVCGSGSSQNFYPRPPRGGRLLRRQDLFQRQPISIHALREEGDSEVQLDTRQDNTFLSTPSARRATQPFRPNLTEKVISIHALREEGDKTTIDRGGKP